MPITLQLNGRRQEFPNLPTPATLQHLVLDLNLKQDRVAVEHNGEIVPRTRWSDTILSPDDKVELVHFVGGGSAGGSSLSPLQGPQSGGGNGRKGIQRKAETDL